MFDFRKLSTILRLEKGLLQVTTGNIGASIAGALFWLFMASIMTVDDYGKLNYYLSIASFVSILSLLGLHNTVISFLSKGDTIIKFRANLLVLASNAVMVPVLLFLIQYPPLVVLVAGLSFFTMSWAELLGDKKYKRYAVIVLLQRTFQVLLSLALFLVFGLDGIIIGYALSVMLFAFNFFKSFGVIVFDMRALREKRSFIAHSFALSLSTSITNFADKLLIAPLFGFAILGSYQISFQFLLFLSVVPVSIFQFLLPRSNSLINDNNTLLKGFVIAASLAGISYLAIPFAIDTFFPHFTDSIPSARIIILGIIPMTANSIMTSKLLAKEKSLYVFIASIVYILSLSVLIYVLGNTFGLIGLAMATLFSLIGQTMALLIPIILKNSFPRGKVS